MKQRGIDVSAHQGKIDWSKVKADGVSFAILRAGFGKERSQEDSCFAQNYRQAKAEGLPLGVYWFSYATTVAEAELEARVCCEILAGRALDFPVFYDWEADSLRYCRSLGVEPTKAMTTAFALAFCKEVERQGYAAGIYSNLSDLQQYFDWAQLKQYPLWLAQWQTDAPSRSCDFWQYSDCVSVDGIAGGVDGNYRMGSENKKPTGKTTANLRLRTQAHTGANIQTVIPKGKTVTLLDDDGWGWSRVQYGSRVGWVSNLYLKAKRRSQYRIGRVQQTLALRDTASRGGTVLQKLPKGTKVFVICILPGNWMQVQCGEQTGYLLYDKKSLAIGGERLGA